MSTSDVIQIVLAVVVTAIGIAGSVIGYLVTRSISKADENLAATNENLAAIRKDVSEARVEVTALLIHRQHDRGEIDDHSRQLAEHRTMLAEHHGEIAILKSKVP